MSNEAQALADADDHTETLAGVISLAEYQRARAAYFPSSTSIQWFCRVYREQLVRRGALLRIAGRLYVDRHLFDHAVREITTLKGA